MCSYYLVRSGGCEGEEEACLCHDRGEGEDGMCACQVQGGGEGEGIRCVRMEGRGEGEEGMGACVCEHGRQDGGGINV